MAGTPVRVTDYARLQAAAAAKGITVSALLFAILFKTTDGLTDFDTAMPEALPRGVVVRPQLKVTTQDAAY